VARILIVEDDPPVRALIRAILSLGGHSVTSAETGEEALTHIGSNPFDLVLLDLMLPEMSGYEVLEKMNDLPGGNDLKVVVVSALDEEDGRGVHEAMLGVLDHITKPFGSREIEDAVHDALAGDVEERRARRRRTAEIYRDTFEVSKALR